MEKKITIKQTETENACKSADEVRDFTNENNVLVDEDLETVSGGATPNGCKCISCGSNEFNIVGSGLGDIKLRCKRCGTLYTARTVAL